MSTYFKALDTREGQVQILTKTRWLGFVPLPHMSVMPHAAADLTRLGTFIRWTTKDPAVLARLHDAIVRLVEDVGISGLAEIAESARTTQRLAKTFGGTLHDIVKLGAKEGVAFPVPEDVLRYIKRFK